MEGCLKDIADCGTKNTIYIDDLCYMSSQTPGQCDTFTPIFTNYDNPSYISSKPGTLLFECIKSCHNLDDCNAIQFSYNNKNNQDETTIPGYCQLVKNNQPGKLLPTPATGNSCVLNFNRSKGATDTDCINIASSNNSLSVDLSSANAPPIKKRILTKYLGASCRKAVADSDLDPNSNRELLQTMGNWCQQNKDIDVCKTFCNNDSYSQFCDIQPNKYPIVMTIIFFVCIFFTIISAIHIENKKIKISVMIMFIIGALVVAYIGYKNYTDYSANQGYPGTKKDYVSGNDWKWNNIGCINGQIFNYTLTNDSCCGSIGGNDTHCQHEKNEYGCPVWDSMNLTDGLSTDKITNTTVIVGLRLYASDTGDGLSGYDNLAYMDLLDENPAIGMNTKYIGKTTTSRAPCDTGPGKGCSVTIGVYATDPKYKIGKDYALQSIQPYFYACKMGTIKFNFAHLWDPSKPVISIEWNGTSNNPKQPCVFKQSDNNNKYCLPPSSKNPIKTILEGPTDETKYPKDVRWFVNNWKIYWSDHDESGHGGCYWFGLHRFYTVSFVGIQDSEPT